MSLAAACRRSLLFLGRQLLVAVGSGASAASVVAAEGEAPGVTIPGRDVGASDGEAVDEDEGASDGDAAGEEASVVGSLGVGSGEGVGEGTGSGDELEPVLPEEDPEPLIVATAPPGNTYVYPEV